LLLDFIDSDDVGGSSDIMVVQPGDLVEDGGPTFSDDDDENEKISEEEEDEVKPQEIISETSKSKKKDRPSKSRNSASKRNSSNDDDADVLDDEAKDLLQNLRDQVLMLCNFFSLSLMVRKWFGRQNFSE
jgi:DNA segregation ATPase FtsK/SpoIIIE-like protein